MTSDGARKGVSSKLKRRMGKRQSRDDSTAPKAKRVRQSQETSSTRQRGKKREQLKPVVRSGGHSSRGGTSKVGTGKTGGRVFRKKSGRK